MKRCVRLILFFTTFINQQCNLFVIGCKSLNISPSYCKKNELAHYSLKIKTHLRSKLGLCKAQSLFISVSTPIYNASITHTKWITLVALANIRINLPYLIFYLIPIVIGKTLEFAVGIVVFLSDSPPFCLQSFYKTAGHYEYESEVTLLILGDTFQIFRSYDKQDDCDLWKDSFFRSRVTRYLCYSRVFPLEGVSIICLHIHEFEERKPRIFASCAGQKNLHGTIMLVVLILVVAYRKETSNPFANLLSKGKSIGLQSCTSCDSYSRDFTSLTLPPSEQ